VVLGHRWVDSERAEGVGAEEDVDGSGLQKLFDCVAGPAFPCGMK
jgi:hypothetical protein